MLLAARAYFPDDRVVAELHKVYQVALSLSSWGLTLEDLARPESEGLCIGPPHVYLHWVHSGAFLTAMQEPHRFDEQVLSCFRRWASLVGLVLDMRFLQFLHLAPVRHNNMGFLAWSVPFFSTARSQYQDLPLPVSYEEMPVWHNVLVVGKSGQTYFSPRLVRAGKLRFYHLFGDTGMHSNLWKHVAPTWKGRYDCLGL